MSRRLPRWLLPGPAGWSPRLYEAFFARTGWGRSIRATEQDAIFTALRGGVRSARGAALEIGAGTGAYTAALARCCDVVDVREPSPAMRRYLQRRADRGSWPGVRIAAGELPHDLGLQRRYDIVVCIGVLNYVPQLDAALTAIAAAVRDDGIVVLNTPTAARVAGARYQFVELLGRRRIHRRDRGEVSVAAQRAGLRIEGGPWPAGVTDVYRLRPAPHATADP